MTPNEVIQLARRRGIRLSIRDDKLKIQSEQPPSVALMVALREHKAEILSVLAREIPHCRACGRRQHQPDVVCGPDLCPSWQEPDPQYPIAPAYVP